MIAFGILLFIVAVTDVLAALVLLLISVVTKKERSRKVAIYALLVGVIMLLMSFTLCSIVMK